MMKRVFSYISALLLALMLSGCGGWLEVQPYDTISEERILTEDGYKLLLNGIYIELCDDNMYGSALGCGMLEMMGGAYEIGSDANVWGNFADLRTYDYGTDYWRSRLDAVWNSTYALILDCNKILDNIGYDKELFHGDNYKIIKGEALALRAMLHFDMFRLFASATDLSRPSIPYYNAVTTTPNSILSGEQALAMVIDDLTKARILLGECDPVLTEGRLFTPAPDGDNFLRYRPLRLNYYAVTALLARAEMWRNGWEPALGYAREVLDAVERGVFPSVGRGSVIVTSGSPDRIFSTEVLFALSHSSRNSLFTNWFSPVRTTYVLRMESNLIENVIYGGGSLTGGYQDDWRNRARWSSSGNRRYFYSYSDLAGAEGSVENTMIPLVRTGEMYLIAAEASNRIHGDDIHGAAYLNALRSARGISETLSAADDEMITYEYIRELYAEGQLFFMYKRRNLPVIWGQNSRVAASEDIFVLPLPDSEKNN